MQQNANSPPSFYLWIVCKLFFIIFPITFLLNLAIVSMGLENNFFTISSSFIIAFFASNAYDRLTVEIRDWVKEELR